MMVSPEQFAAETAIGLIKPFHRVECRCDECIGWLQIEFCKRVAEIQRLQDENGQLYLWKDAAIRQFPPIAKELAEYQKTPCETEQVEKIERLGTFIRCLPPSVCVPGEICEAAEAAAQKS